MEDDAGVKAPVTRLRRRLSVEQSEESKSPAVNTPTKRRGRKKPELELIDENSTENTKTQRTRKAALKEVIEPVEEKVVTPSRRSTRIKSNTSIVSESAVAVASPRAKRATRRASQVGSDNEAPPTPIRTTRRTRKDSTSSLEKVEVQPALKPVLQITEVIVEEPESNSRQSTSAEVADKQSPSPNSFRKSPRLMKKLNQSINKNEDAVADQSNSNQDAPIPDKIEVPVEKPLPSDSSETKDEEVSGTQNNQKDRLSISSANLIRDLDTKGKDKKNKINLNKSNPVVALQNVVKTKRNRTKSWTTDNQSSENNFLSDNECNKNKIKENIKSPLAFDRSASGDVKNTSLNLNKSKNRDRNSNSFVVVDDTDKSVNVENNKSKNVNEMEIDNENKTHNNIDGDTSLLYKEPSGDIKTSVVIEDSDSNSGKTNAQNVNDSGDQCVPVVEQNSLKENQFTIIPDNMLILNKSKNRTITDNSCEPMDVDETIPDSMVIADAEIKERDASRKSWSNNEKEVRISIGEKENKSHSKISLSGNINKSDVENKSTLMFSHLKDTSVGKSPKNSNKLLSKSAIDLDVTQENEANIKNLSLNYLTSTPLQHKSIQKLAMQVNTSIITSNNDSKHVIENLESNSEKTSKSDFNEEKDSSNKENNPITNVEEEKMDLSSTKKSLKDDSIKDQENQKKNNLSKNKKDESKIDESDESDDETPIKKPNKLKGKGSKQNKISSLTSNDSDEENDSENESEQNNMLDDEAEDVGDDYQSGDSQDESERQYERENEILEKGETLTSDNDDISNDSDYEKDSFIVSSDEEDNELLEGTEDDLSMSDNELKMTAKSKKKYDERKLKEQKKASREMYESRHKINNKAEKAKKTKLQQLSSSESESEKESEKPKKNNRMRLDSSHDLDEESDKCISKKKTPRLSKSVSEEAENEQEQEITIANESIKENDPLIQIKEEPKTPLKSANATIAFIDSEDGNKNESTKTQTELQDPLEDSMEDDEHSLCSENEEIMQNYDSILNDLNKSNKIKTKTCDISLNLDNKSKKKEKTAIVDELNLTAVKSTKKVKSGKQSDIKTEKEEKLKVDGESSDSIDIHLLFSEDSNDSEDIRKKNKKGDAEDKFIPLKRTEAKSNILEDSNSKTANVSLNASARNKKRQSQIDDVTCTGTADDTYINFFIDTEGTPNDTLNKSQSNSLKNKKKLSTSNNVNSMDADSDEIPPQEDLFILKQETEVKDKTDSTANKTLNKSITKTPGSAKKKATHIIVEEKVTDSDSDAPIEVSFKKEKPEQMEGSLKISKEEIGFNKSLNKSLVKTPVSEKKKKTKTHNLEDNEESNTTINRSLVKTPKNGRKTLDQDVETIESADEKTFIEKSFDKPLTKTPGSDKKKKKALRNVGDEEIGNVASVETVLNNSVSGKKKKKSISEPLENSVHEEQVIQAGNISLIKTPGSNKKKKMSESHIENDNALCTELPLNKSMTKTPGSERKKNKSILCDQSEEIEATLNASRNKTPGSQKKNDVPNSSKDNLDNDETNAKKRKRKSSLNNQAEETVETIKGAQTHLFNESLVVNQKKKRKITQGETKEVTIYANKNENHEKVNDVLVDVAKKQKSKKRKERDEEEGNNISKVSKQNSFDKAHIPRLPPSLLQQLDDKPRTKKLEPQPKKMKVISTTQFIVEETKKRKTKPSNYLEESVYIDDDDECERKKSKGKIMKPKVLPFVPTACTSNSGYTSTFKVNIIPKEIKFVAEPSSVGNFKDDYLYNKKIKRQGTYELYKRNRNLKISKF